MYLSIKLIHIISSTLLFGTGLGSAFYMYMAYRSNNLQAMAVTNRIVVIADFIFTAPTVIIQLISGLYLLNYLGQAWTSAWSLSVLALYAFVGACWLPVVWLQICLRNRAQAILDKTAKNEISKDKICLDAQYITAMRWWMLLGAMAFPAVVILYAFMVYKPWWG